MRSALDLHHVGPVLGEEAAGLHPDGALAEVHDPQSGERQGRLGQRSAGAGLAEGGEDLLGVLPDGRCRRGGPGALAVELEVARRDAGHDTGSDLQVPEGATRREVLVGEHARRVEHRGADDPPLLGLLGDGLHAHVGEELLVQRVEHGVGDGEAAGERLVLLVLQVLGLTQPRPHGPPLRRAQDDEADVAVPALEDRVHRARPVADVVALETHRPTHRVVRQRPVGGLGEGLVERDVEELAGAGLLALPQGAEDRPRHHRAGHVVAELSRGGQRLAVDDTGLEGHAARGRQHLVGGHPAGPGAGEAVGRGGGDDEVGVGRGQLLDRQALAQRRCRGHQDVGMAEQLVEALDVTRVVEIEGDAELAGVGHRERQRHAPADRRQASGR